jgi:PiT family inorganic phosphate transporter
MLDHGWILLAAAFAVVTGVNDGGSVLSTGLKVPSVKPLNAVLVLVTCMAVVPFFSTSVATGFAVRLVAFRGPDARIAVAGAVVSAVLLVLVLTHRGLPTSLTLALVGGLTGSGLGFGLDVSWPAVAKVLSVGACAPLVGCLLAYLISRAMRFAPSAPPLNGAVYRMHRVAFGMQAVAYASNDGQKVLAIWAALGIGVLAVGPSPVVLTGICVAFGVGVVLGLPRVARGLSNGVLLVRPAHAVAAELASSLAVLGSAAIGVPVSMTQSIAGGLIGTGISHGRRRIRWREVSRIGLAWVITLPSSCLLAAAAAITLRSL